MPLGPAAHIAVLLRARNCFNWGRVKHIKDFWPKMKATNFGSVAFLGNMAAWWALVRLVFASYLQTQKEETPATRA
jgi:hypothetical protein